MYLLHEIEPDVLRKKEILRGRVQSARVPSGYFILGSYMPKLRARTAETSTPDSPGKSTFELGPLQHLPSLGPECQEDSTRDLSDFKLIAMSSSRGV